MESGIDERYERLSSAGSGAFGMVWKARDRRDGRLVALKILRKLRVGDLGRFLEQAEALAALQHPVVVPYLDHGRTDSGQRYTVTPWLNGMSLKQKLGSGPLTITEGMALLRRLADGLRAGAVKGVVHQNVTPGNVFLVGETGAEACLLDFGLEGRIEIAQSLSQLYVNTPFYLAPEQARGNRAAERSDVFALGAVIYECLTGIPPFRGPNALATLGKICLDEPAAIETMRPELPRALTLLVAEMLRKEAAERPDYAAIIERVEGVGGGERVVFSAPPSVRPVYLGKAEQRVLAAVFVGGGAPEGAKERERVLDRLVEVRRLGCERLLDGSRILTFGVGLATPRDQVQQAARCALGIRDYVKDVPIVICLGRAQLERGSLLGAILEQGSELLAHTKPGRIQLDEPSAMLAKGRFEVVERAGMHRLLAERPDAETGAFTFQGSAPFLGRERELAQLSAVVAHSREERAATATLITGPAGAGKSRLCLELIAALQREEDRPTILMGRGDPMRSGSSFSVLSPALFERAGVNSLDPAELRARKLLEMLRRVLPTRAAEVAPVLGEMVGVSFDAQSPIQSIRLQLGKGDPQLMPDLILDAWLSWLEAESARAPVLMVVEDLHWADLASVRFLDAALSALADAPFALLAFARPEVHDAHPKLWQQRGLVEIPLSRLSVRACERLLDALGGRALDAATRMGVLERANGNPFFIEELVRALRSSAGDLSRLPDSILGVLQARLDVLGEDVKALLRAASVFGTVFPADGLRTLLKNQMSQLELKAHLGRLLERDVLVPCAAEAGGDYAFRHALIRDAAYALLPDDKRAAAHGLVARWLEGAPGISPAVVAEHFERAGASALAASWYAQALKQAMEAGSQEEAVRFGERALASASDPELRVEVASWLAEALSYLHRDHEAVRHGRMAYECACGGSSAWWRAVQVLAVSGIRSGLPEASGVAEEVFSAPTAGSADARVMAITVIAGNASLFGLRELGDRLLALLPVWSDPTLAERTRGMLLTLEALKQWESAPSLTAAQQHLASEAFQRAGALRDLMQSLVNEGSYLCELGALQASTERLEEALALGQRLDTRPVCARALLWLGLIAQAQQRAADAIRLIRESAQLSQELGWASCQAMAGAHLALVLAAEGQNQSAAAEAHRAVALADRDVSALAVALAASAQLARASDPAAALRDSGEAVRLWRVHAIVERAPLIRLAYVESLLACERMDEAKRELEDAARWVRDRAATIDDANVRASFLTVLPENERLLGLAETWLQ